MSNMMKGTYLPGDSRVVLKYVKILEPVHGKVLIRTKSSKIYGSGMHAIYREHLEKARRAIRIKIKLVYT